jgi:predicted Zn-dependent peptidase
LLKRYKASAHGEWETESVSLADRAWSISTFVEQGADPDYAQTALAAIDATSAADVQRVAAAYLRKFTVALIVPRGKSQIN